MSKVSFTQDNTNILYNNVPKHLIETISENDSIWLHSKEHKIKIITNEYCEPDHFLPIGINEKYAIGYHSKSDLNFLKNIMKSFEIFQYTQIWKLQLKNCKFRGKYDYYMDNLWDRVKIDSSLKPIIESIIKDEELQTFKNNLPKEKPIINEKEQKQEEEETKPLLMGKRGLLIHGEKEKDFTSHVRLLVNRITSKKNKGWKETNIVIPCDHLLPSFFLYKNYVLIAYYISKSVAKVILYDLDNNYKIVFENYIYNIYGTLLCTTNGKFIVVSDGYSANILPITIEEEYTVFAIKDEVITACNINQNDDILLGTYSGLYYRISLAGRIRFAYKHPENITILNIDVSGDQVLLQTIASVTLLEGIYLGNTLQHLIFERPISSCIHGRKILILNKYNHLHFILDKSQNVIVLEGKKISNLPWFKGLYINEDGSMIYTLSSEGKVRLNYI